MEIGDLRVQSVVADVMRVAGMQWRVSLSGRAVARDLGIRQPTIQQIVADQMERFDLRTLGLLCAYFWCYPGELLIYTTPDVDVPKRVGRAVRRPRRPDDLGAIPRIVVKAPSLSLEDQRRLPRHTMTRLQGDVQQIERGTLAAVCAVAGCEVSDILQLEERWPEE